MRLDKLKNLKENIKSTGKCAVAFSGGVDSTFLLKICRDELGFENVHAFTGVSPSCTEREIDFSKKFSLEINVRHSLIETNEFSDKNYLANPKNRCYFCKREIFAKIKDKAGSLGFNTVFDGSNYDDLDDFRPGMKALRELSIKSPLLEAKLTKEDIRFFSKQLSLPTWDQPASPCLSSRIPYGSVINEQKLKNVEKAEKYLSELGFKLLRVRHHEKIARVEVAEKEIEMIVSPENRKKIDTYFKSLGFVWVCLDLKGYRMGSLNEINADLNSNQDT